MNLEFRQHKQAIRSFMQLHYTDERLAQLLAHAADGKLNYYSCCCFIGVATSDHPLQVGFNFHLDPAHCETARGLSGGDEAEKAFIHLSQRGLDDDYQRRRILIPMIRAEIRRRDQFKTSVGEYCDVHQEAVSG